MLNKQSHSWVKLIFENTESVLIKSHVFLRIILSDYTKRAVFIKNSEKELVSYTSEGFNNIYLIAEKEELFLLDNIIFTMYDSDEPNEQLDLFRSHILEGQDISSIAFYDKNLNETASYFVNWKEDENDEYRNTNQSILEEENTISILIS